MEKQKVFHCYALRSINPEFLNTSYVGFTHDTDHRLRQHNRIIMGGAKKTSKRRPWELAIVVSGFSTKSIALSFEYAW